MWHVYFSHFETSTTRKVIQGLREKLDAEQAAERLNQSYQRASPAPNGVYYVLPAFVDTVV